MPATYPPSTHEKLLPSDDGNDDADDGDDLFQDAKGEELFDAGDVLTQPGSSAERRAPSSQQQQQQQHSQRPQQQHPPHPQQQHFHHRSASRSDDPRPAVSLAPHTHTPASTSTSTATSHSHARRPLLLSSATAASQIFGQGTPRGSHEHAHHARQHPHDDDNNDIEDMAKPARIKTKDDFWKRGVVVGALIASWYFFSTLISVYNKWMFDPKKHNFPYPIFVTSLHMAVQFAISTLLVVTLDRTGKVILVPRRPDGKRRRPSGHDWASKVFPCALASALDIGLSNTSLKSISLTLYTMCKSSNLVFVLIFAFLFRLERLRWNLVGVIGIITIGVIMMVAAETELVVIGAVEVLLASAMGGLRWALTQMLLEKEKLGMTNPVAAILWLCPIMAVLLISSSVVLEDWSSILSSKEFSGGLARSLKTLGMVTAPGCLAFCMNVSEYALIQRTSVVTLSVAGIFKEILTVIIASLVFDDHLTPVNITGLCIAIAGIAAYNYIKYRGLNEAGASGGRGAPTGAEAAEYQRVGTTADANEGYGDEGEWSAARGQFALGGDEDSDGDSEDEEHGAKRKRKGLPPGTTSGTGMEEALEERPAQRGTSKLREARNAEEEERKRRMREEEADLEGWGSSGFTLHGNGEHYPPGYDEDDDDDDDAEQPRSSRGERGPCPRGVATVEKAWRARI